MGNDLRPPLLIPPPPLLLAFNYKREGGVKRGDRKLFPRIYFKIFYRFFKKLPGRNKVMTHTGYPGNKEFHFN